MDRQSNEHEAERTGPEDYLGLNEREKDMEITRAIIRLQNRIQTLLYAAGFETGKRRNLNDETTENEASHGDETSPRSSE